MRAAADPSASSLAPWQHAVMQQIAWQATGVVDQRVTATANPADGEWKPLPGQEGGGPFGPGRFFHTAIYDAPRDRMVIFGGWDGTPRNDVWEVTLSGAPVWTKLSPSGTPPSARYAHSAIYDPVRERMIVFGGYDGSARNDVWSLSLAGSPAWSQLGAAGTPPIPRLGHDAVYDPVRDRMVIFGGSDVGSYQDTWGLSLSGTPTWTQLVASGPPRSFATTIYDPVRDRLVMFGGYNGSADVNDTWTLPLSGGAWAPMSVGGAPPIRRGHSAIYDPVRDRMVVFGGGFGVSTFLGDCWVLTFGGTPSWSAVAGSGPSVRALHSAIYDPVRDRMVVNGGNDGLQFLGDLWSLSFSGGVSWTLLGPSYAPPSARDAHSAIYDPLRQRMVVFGGYDGIIGNNEVWTLSMDASMTWTKLTPAGLPPSVRFGHSAIYDPVRDRMLVFAGRNSSGYLNDVWALSLSGTPTWNPVSTAGTPPSARYVHTAIYDPAADRMVVFGGFSGGIAGDTWFLSLSGVPTWSPLATGTQPGGRYLQSAVYDPVRSRMVMFGGYNGSAYLNDTWELSLGATPAWTLLATSTPPDARLASSAIYDAARDRMVVFGGYGGDWLDETWTLSLGTLVWTELFPEGEVPAPRELHTAISDPANDRMVVFAGHNTHYLRDGFTLDFGNGTPPPPTAEVRFDFTPRTLSLSSHGLWVNVTLEPLSPFTADQIDIASLRINGSVAVDPAAPVSIADHDGDKVADLKVKFDRASVEQTVSDGDEVPITATGTVGGATFSEVIHIKVRRAVVHSPQAAAHVMGGSVFPVQWQLASADTAQVAGADTLANGADSTISVAVLYSANEGASWDLIASGQPNTGHYDWLVPNTSCDHAKLAVVLVHSADSTGDVVLGTLGESETFSIETMVGVGEAEQRPMLWASPNPVVNSRIGVQFVLRNASPARLDLMDLGGRVLISRQVGRYGPGLHALELAGGARLPPGVYFLRLTQDGDEVRARAAVIR